MTKQTNSKAKIIRWFFGIEGPIDEHVHAVIGRASTTAVISLILFQFGLAIAVILWPIHNYEDALWLVIGIELLASLWIVVLTVSRAVSKNDLDRSEVLPADYAGTKRRLRWRLLLTTPIMIISYDVLVAAFGIRQTAFLTALLDPHQLFQAVIFGLILCPVIYGTKVRKIKVVDATL